MYQIVYTSSANRDFSAADLNTLLRTARARNKALGVTGTMIFHDGIFLQALEGEDRAVNEVFARIRIDPRHGELAMLHRGSGADQRVFGDWPMAFADFTGAAAFLQGFVRFNAQLKLRDLDSADAVGLLTACGDEEVLKSA